ncbi:MAG: 3-phosphoshikimate 1-carboxyvinyltransferase [Planctomycetes bacterium]|nr:3-phosphoshikimate 1-carboxyvinyltransferase [Planctomycetota bacterium]
MPDFLAIQPTGPISGSIRPPGSKSITNRALVCAALAEGESILSGALESEDTEVMIAALRQLGLTISVDASRHEIRITGCGGRLPASGGTLFVANSGTTTRFLAAMLTLGRGTFRLDGTPRMRERPIQDLLDALAQLGAAARSEQGTGCPPVIIEADGLPGGRAAIRGDVSSQFLSGLLMAAPYARSPVELFVPGELVSQPYIQMTLAVMAAFGVRVNLVGQNTFQVPIGIGYRGRAYAIEPDASAASYFFAAAAITGGQVMVKGLSRASLQGDVAFVDVLRQMGCEVAFAEDEITITGRPLRGVDVNMNAISDTVQTLGAVALFAEGPTNISGIGHIRHKETDRIAALATELRKLGADVIERDDGLTIRPAALHGARIATYNDHRMAMSLALVGLAVPGIEISNPGCTAKTYPNYFADLAGLVGGSRRSPTVPS